MAATSVDKSGRRVDLDALLGGVDLAAVATNWMGSPPGRRGERSRRLWWCCPFHEDKNPSLAIDPGRRWWNCYGCKAKGTAIDLMMRLGGLGFLDACRTLAGGAGVDPVSIGLRPSVSTIGEATINRRGEPLRARVPINPDARSRDTPADGPRGLAPADARALVDRAAAKLWTPEGADGLAMFRRRGFRDETIRAARLGWTDWTAAFRRDGTSYQTRGVVIPWHDRGRLTLVKVKTPEGTKPKYAEVFAGAPTVYTAAPIRPGKPLVIVEGELDALTVAQEAGEWAGVVTLGSASGRITPAALALLAAATPWLIATDADGAGDKAALDWLTPFKARCVRVRPPEGVKDWNELHVGNPGAVRSTFARLAGGTEALWSILEPLRWGRGDGPEDEPSNVLADEPSPRLPEGWTHADYLAHLIAGGSPCP